jgi:hypothetical protein
MFAWRSASTEEITLESTCSFNSHTYNLETSFTPGVKRLWQQLTAQAKCQTLVASTLYAVLLTYLQQYDIFAPCS